jgi:glycosyltransferase involved in cell wall biosynthesis
MSKQSQLPSAIIQVTAYYPPHLGGIENCVAQIAKRLVSRGYAVRVYTSDIDAHQRSMNQSGLQVRYLRSIEFAHTPIIFSLFFHLLSLPRHALIHLHAAQAFTPEIVYLVSKIRRIPYITHFHIDVDPSGPYGFLLGTYKKFFLKRVLQSAAKIICLSEPQKQAIAAKYELPLESIVVISNGVDEAYFVGVREKTEPAPIPHLLFVGRLVAQKNLALLIEAVTHMKTPVIVDIVGEGELREHLARLIQQHQLTNVRLHGKKTGKELLEFYHSADVFVLPSFKEGISLSMLEALAAGLPVVATDSPEIRTILEDCGVLIEEPTPANYARALDQLLASKETMQKLRALSEQKARSHSWENILNALEEVYRQVISVETEPSEREIAAKLQPDHSN